MSAKSDGWLVMYDYAPVLARCLRCWDTLSWPPLAERMAGFVKIHGRWRPRAVEGLDEA